MHKRLAHFRVNDSSNNFSQSEDFSQPNLTAAASADHKKITRVISDTGFYINKTAVESLAFGPDVRSAVVLPVL